MVGVGNVPGSIHAISKSSSVTSTSGAAKRDSAGPRDKPLTTKSVPRGRSTKKVRRGRPTKEDIAIRGGADSARAIGTSTRAAVRSRDAHLDFMRSLAPEPPRHGVLSAPTPSLFLPTDSDGKPAVPRERAANSAWDLEHFVALPDEKEAEAELVATGKRCHEVEDGVVEGDGVSAEGVECVLCPNEAIQIVRVSLALFRFLHFADSILRSYPTAWGLTFPLHLQCEKAAI